MRDTHGTYKRKHDATAGRTLLLPVVVLCLVGLGAFLLIRYPVGLPGVPKDMVFDEAGLMDEDQSRFVSEYHALLLQDHDIDYRVLTTTETGGEVNIFAHRKFAELDVGSKSENGRGLLLIVDPEADRVRLEVSTALEGVFTDAFVAYIQQRQMVHFFQSGRVEDGILAATELIWTRAQDAEQGRAFQPGADDARSAGAGAATDALLGDGGGAPVVPKGPLPKDYAPADTGPLLTVAQYLEAMSKRDNRPNLSIYTAGTRQMLANWTVTPAQMDNVVRSYKQCGEHELRVSGAYAVVRYPPEKRTCSPWFLQKEDGKWRLDLTMMQKSMIFNHRNQWHFKNYDHPYMFGFSDWRFDSHGFPRTR